MMQIAPLPERGVVRMTGADAARLLQGLITADIDRLEQQPALFAGLLSPQGKILFDFFVAPTEDGFLLETAKHLCSDLVKRLTFYKLRANVTLSDVSQDYSVAAAWNGGAPEIQPGAVAYPDPRLPELGWRILVPDTQQAAFLSSTPASATDYEARRIQLGVPEGGRDYAYGDTFPHEALFDQVGGVDFDKGCYVGQEVVSRMEHRSTARKRIVQLIGAAALTAGSEVKVGEATIGKVGSVAGQRALALLRLDRVGEAQEKGQALTADGVPITVVLPPWVRFSIPSRLAGEPT